MLNPDLQRFDDSEQTNTTQSDSSADESVDKEPAFDDTAEPDAQEDLPEGLEDLPEDVAREAFNEWQKIQAEQQPQQPEQEPQDTQEPPITREQYNSVAEELKQLKAQLSALQQGQQPQQQPQQQQQQPARQAPRYQQPQFRMTPEFSKQFKQAVESEAMNMTGFTPEDIAAIQYADDDDERVIQWNQAKSFAQGNILSAIRQAQINKYQETQQFLAAHDSAVAEYNKFVQQEFADPDAPAIRDFATNEYFEQLSPSEQRILAESYVHVEHQTASPSEMLVVKNYYQRAKSAFRSRANNAKANKPTLNQKAARLPRTDQIQGSASTSDGKLSTRDIEELLKRDFTTLTPKQQNILLGLS